MMHTDPYDKLTSYARRVKTLLNNPLVYAEKDVKGSLDELLGSICSLMIAKHLGYKDRITAPKSLKLIQQEAEALSNADVPLDGVWIAGYYMNSATYRTASVYHRFLTIINGVPQNKIKYVGELLPATEQNYKKRTGGAWNHTNLDIVHEESIKLKHKNEGVHSGRGLWCKDSVT